MNELVGPDRMAGVRRERAAAEAQIRRMIGASRKASGAAEGPARIPTGSGTPLDSEVRRKMEPRLGADLSNVRVHAGGDSAQTAAQLGARAFTVGRDVHFGAGQLAPGTKEGDRLLAHELTHVVQGDRAGIARKAESDGGATADGEIAPEDVSQPSDPAEEEADTVADGVAESLHDDKKKPDEKPEKPDAKSDAKAPAKEKAPSIGRKVARVSRNMVGHQPGFYNNVPSGGTGGTLHPTDQSATGTLTFVDNPQGLHPDGRTPRTIETIITYQPPNPSQSPRTGSITQSFEMNPSTGERRLVISSAFMDSLPPEAKWVSDGGQPFVPGRGTPLQVYIRTRQMRIFGITENDLGSPSFSKVQLRNVVNLPTVLYVAEKAGYSGTSPPWPALEHAPLVDFARTPIEQAGAKITDAVVDGGVRHTKTTFVNQNPSVTTEQKNKIPDTGTVITNFNIDLTVARLNATSNPPSTVS
jgi:hypothetical protein